MPCSLARSGQKVTRIFKRVYDERLPQYVQIGQPMILWHDWVQCLVQVQHASCLCLPLSTVCLSIALYCLYFISYPSTSHLLSPFPSLSYLPFVIRSSFLPPPLSSPFRNKSPILIFETAFTPRLKQPLSSIYLRAHQLHGFRPYLLLCALQPPTVVFHDNTKLQRVTRACASPRVCTPTDLQQDYHPTNFSWEILPIDILDSRNTEYNVDPIVNLTVNLLRTGK